MKIHTVQLNLSDFDEGTNGLNPLEFTIYTRLLLASYKQRLSDDNEVLARIARVNKKDIKKCREVIDRKFKKVDGFLQNTRTELEREKYKKLSELNTKKANERWKTKDRVMPAASDRHSQNNETASASAMQSNNHNLTPNNYNTPITPSPNQPEKAGMSVEKFQEFVENDFKPLGSLLLQIPGDLGVSKQSFEEKKIELLPSNSPRITGKDIVNQLDDQARQRVIENTYKKFDLYFLADVYAKGINDNKRSMPNSINAAFPEWCGRYYQGSLRKK